jgi:ABC-type Fe3+-hydroxamate transport system substrate-binding protein
LILYYVGHPGANATIVAVRWAVMLRFALKYAIRLTLVLPIVVMALSCSNREPTTAPVNSGEVGELRIVSLSPAISILLTELGLESHIVGRHGWDRTLDADLPVVGDQTGIDYEKLLRLDPTHIIIEQGAEELPRRLFELAESKDWQVLSVPLLALDDIPRAISAMAAFLETVSPDVVNRSAELLQRTADAWRFNPDLAQRAGRTLCVYWTSPIGVAGPGSFHHDLLGRLGIKAVPATGGPYITLDLEDLKRMNPDTIFLLTPELDKAGVDAAIKSWNPLGLSAVKAGRVVLLGDPLFLTPSTAMIELARRITQTVTDWPIQSNP